MNKIVLAAVAAFAVAGCGEAGENAGGLQGQADVAVDERGLVEAIGSAVDKQAIEGLARGAVQDALNEVLPAEEMAAVGAVIDEEALAKGIDEAIDGQALGAAAQGAVDRVTGSVER